jgi:dTDP-4-dehydrorhamnose reductase
MYNVKESGIKMNKLKKALIGYTGFVGSNLLGQIEFDKIFNSKNIEKIENENFDLVVCAAPSATKWKANLYPKRDFEEINGLINNLKKINTGIYIQISTVDIYDKPLNVNEDFSVESEDLNPYGKNRFHLEEFVRHNFEKYLVVRLPALFGPGIKKNFIFDMIHNNCLELTDKDSEFQFYCLNNLWADISVAIQNSIKTLNITSEPISACDIAMNCFGRDFLNTTEKPPVKYDVRSKYDYLFNGKNGYMYNRRTIIKELKEFVNNNR